MFWFRKKVRRDMRAVVNQILITAYDMQIDMDPLKVSRMFYLAQGYCLGFTGLPLTEEECEVGVLQPVLPRGIMCKLHDMQISVPEKVDIDWNTMKIKDISGREDGPIRGEIKFDTLDLPYRSRFSDKEDEIIRGVVRHYSHLYSWKLRDLLYADGTPYHIAKTKNGMGASISNKLMKDQFVQQVERLKIKLQTKGKVA